MNVPIILADAPTSANNRRQLELSRKHPLSTRPPFKLSKILWHRDSKFFAQRRHVSKVFLFERVPTMKFNHPFRRNTSHRYAVYRARSCQRIRWVHLPVFYRTVNSVSLFVEHNHVKIDFSPRWVTQDKIPGPCLLGLCFFEFPFLQDAAHFLHIFLLHSDVEVFMRAGLVA